MSKLPLFELPEASVLTSEQIKEMCRHTHPWFRAMGNHIRVTLAAAEKRAERKRCPCEFGNPCDSRCTCANPVMSGGCRRCCTYGSPEQQQHAANIIIESESRAARYEQALDVKEPPNA